MRRAGIEPTGYKKEEENASKTIPPHKTAYMSPEQSAVYSVQAGASQLHCQRFRQSSAFPHFELSLPAFSAEKLLNMLSIFHSVFVLFLLNILSTYVIIITHL